MRWQEECLNVLDILYKNGDFTLKKNGIKTRSGKSISKKKIKRIFRCWRMK